MWVQNRSGHAELCETSVVKLDIQPQLGDIDSQWRRGHIRELGVNWQLHSKLFMFKKKVFVQGNGLLFSKLGSTLREEQDSWTNTLLAYALARGSNGDQSSVDSSLLTPQTCITVLKIKINHPKLSVVLINYQFSLQSVSWGCVLVSSNSLVAIVCLTVM